MTKGERLTIAAMGILAITEHVHFAELSIAILIYTQHNSGLKCVEYRKNSISVWHP